MEYGCSVTEVEISKAFGDAWRSERFEGVGMGVGRKAEILEGGS